ncbi:universal stress protein [Haloarchaeobius sp. DFWS5]|uniref:universal stress protein n=1 Tax=Haloarchaeobius sp. DFWS5 TaxID=3446114 RepID=UPI003EC02E84
MSHSHHALLVRTNGSLTDGIVLLAAELAGGGLPEGYGPTIVAVTNRTDDEVVPGETRRHVASDALHANRLAADATVRWHTVDAETPTDALESAVESEAPGITVVPTELGADVAESIAASSDSTVVLAPNDPALGRSESVLAAVGTGPHSGAVVDTAVALSRATDATVTLVHVGDDSAGRALLDSAAARADDCAVETRTVAGDPTDALLDLAPDFDAFVIGGPTHGGLRRFAFGSTSERLREESDTLALTVWGDGDDALGPHGGTH